MHAKGGRRHASPDFFLKKNCAIWCILGPILAFIALLFLRLIFQMLPLQTSLKKET